MSALLDQAPRTDLKLFRDIIQNRLGRGELGRGPQRCYFAPLCVQTFHPIANLAQKCFPAKGCLPPNRPHGVSISRMSPSSTKRRYSMRPLSVELPNSSRIIGSLTKENGFVNPA